jgi:hypothetical protein
MVAWIGVCTAVQEEANDFVVSQQGSSMESCTAFLVLDIELAAKPD